MDAAKRNRLVKELSAQPAPQIVDIERYFDGNDDPASIGCNLMDHPGVDSFRDALTGLLRRPDVEAVYASISDLDPGPEYWPFTDTVLVVGTIPQDELKNALTTVQPDEVGAAEDFGISSPVLKIHDAPVLAVWWD